MRILFGVLTTILFAIGNTSPIYAQGSSPEEVTMAYVNAFAEGDIAKATSFMHPEALASVKTLFVEIARADSTLGAMFAGSSDPDSIQARSTEDIFTHFLDILFSLQPDLEETLAASSVNIIGSVAEGDSLMHVVVRTSGAYQGLDFQTMGITSLKRFEDGWRLLLKEEMATMLTALKASTEAQE